MTRHSAILAAIICLMSSIGAADCKEGHVHLSGPWGSAKFHVEVMDDARERARGLCTGRSWASFRPCCLFMSVSAACRFG